MNSPASLYSRGDSATVPLTSAVEVESSASRISHRKSASMDATHSRAPLDPIPLSTRHRSDSSSTFQPFLLSRSDSTYDPSEPSPSSDRHLTLLSSVALVTGMMIGSGIFSSPGLIVALTGSVGASLVVWLVGGLLAWTGASSYAELGAAIPLDGGTQVYLSYAYGPLASYLFVWTASLALKPGSAAIIALVFGEYINRLIYHHTTEADGEVVLAPEWSIKITAVIVLFAIGLLNMISPRSGTQAQVVLTAIKMISLAAVIILGFVSLIRNGIGPSFSEGVFSGTVGNPSNYAIALYSSLWAFEGWDSSNYVAGQMTNPTRDLPRTIHVSMTTIVILYLLTNVSYFLVLSKDIVASSNTVVLDYGIKLFGTVAATVFSIVVGISCFGSLNAGLYTTSRLLFASAKDGLLPSGLAVLSSSRGTPDRAIIFQTVMTCVFVVFGGGFRSLVSFFSVANWTFFFATVMGLLVLRVKEPMLERPYRANIATPITFCVVALFLLLMPIVAAPWEAAAAFAFILAGVPAYYLVVRRQSGGSSSEAVKWTERIPNAWNAMVADVRSVLPSKLGGNSGVKPEEGGYDRIEMTER